MNNSIIKATLQDLKLELWLRQRENNSIQWVTKEGKHIPIKDLETSHLINTIKYLSRQEQLREDYYDALSGYDRDF